MSKTHYSRDEAEDLLHRLTDDDIKRATAYSEDISNRARKAIDPRDLLDEAILRTLDGSRHWKRGMRPAEHLFGVMRSIQNSWLKAVTRAKAGHSLFVDSLSIEDQEVKEEWPVELLVELQQRAESLLTEGRLNMVEQCVLRGFIQGLEPKNILSRCRITAKRYVDTLLSLAASLTRQSR